MQPGNEVDQLFHDICVNSNEQSYNALYTSLCSKLIHFSASIVGSFVMAEEIVSDVFIMLWQKRTKFTDVHNPVVYLYVCTRNFSLNALPGKKAHIAFDLLDSDALAIVPDVERRLVSGEVKQVLEKAINELPARCRLIFRLVKMDGLSYKDVADILDISVKTVDAQLAIAIKKLSLTIRLVMPDELVQDYFHAG